MDIFDYALKMELDGEKYYREQAQKVKYDDLKIVLEGLADDELRHYKIIQLAKNQTFQYIEADPALRNRPNVFSVRESKTDVLKHKSSIEKLKDEQIDVYREALKIENESVDLYKKMKEDAKSEEEKTVFEKLMHEEEKHVQVIDTIIDSLNHVKDWVEAAEFTHTETY